MIALVLFSLGVIGWRIRQRRFTRAEGMLLAVVAVNYAIVVGQSLFEGGRFRLNFPEARYTIQSTLLLYPWGIWGILSAFKTAKLARRCLAVTFAGFAVLATVMLGKSKLPCSRRYAYVRACDWAVERIRADWHGPATDRKYDFHQKEYHRPNRPVVQAHTARLPYLLNGRLSSLDIVGKVDTPDYWFDDIDREVPPKKGYDKLDSYRCGNYRFELYRRQGKGKWE